MNSKKAPTSIGAFICFGLEKGLLFTGLTAVPQNLFVDRVAQLLRQFQELFVIRLLKHGFCEVMPGSLDRTLIFRIVTPAEMIVRAVRHPKPHDQSRAFGPVTIPATSASHQPGRCRPSSRKTIRRAGQPSCPLQSGNRQAAFANPAPRGRSPSTHSSGLWRNPARS